MNGLVTGFFRPEARALLWRWREVICGAVIVLIGLWWIIGPGLLLGWIGYLLLAVGAVFVFLGVQRARFRGTGGGAGAVQVVEGQITYFGPLTGGTVALRELHRLSLERGMFPAHWKLEQQGRAPLLIPVNAAGSEALFDAFATLPGLRTERMLTELNAQDDAARPRAIVIWHKPQIAAKSVTVH